MMHLSKVQQHVSNVRLKITFAPKTIFSAIYFQLNFFHVATEKQANQKPMMWVRCTFPQPAGGSLQQG